MKRDSIRVLGWRRVLKENRKMKSTKKYNRHTYIYIWRKDSQIRERKALHVKVMAKENK